MKVAILGYGIDGKVSADYWLAKGDEVTVCDKNENLALPEQFQKRLGPDHMRELEAFDLIVRTPGIPPQVIAENNPDHPEVMDRVTTNLNEFLVVCPSKNVIGVTGTKGKGTTSTLITKMLEAAGLTAHLGGNIGIAALEMLPAIQPDDWVVLELSSFQLMDLTQSIGVAVCLMIAPEHLNWHANMDEYMGAKANLFRLQPADGRTIFNRRSELSEKVAAVSPAPKESYEVAPEGEALLETTGSYVQDGTFYHEGEAICEISQMAQIGRHNLENACAAISAVWPIIGGNKTAITDTLRSFHGLAHHLEYVTEIDGVKYYDDSYSTMPDATIAALEAIHKPKVLILGGGSKGLDLQAMIDAVAKADVRHVVVNGSLAGQLQDMLAKANVMAVSESPNDMHGIVAEAQKYAQTGDVVLLSPGLPAKGDGYFIDNVDRGNQFKQVVRGQA